MKGVTTPVYCGVDFHARQQVVGWCDTNDGEIQITKLDHSDLEKFRQFYQAFSEPGIIGLEACGDSQRFEDLLFELNHEVRIGNPAEICSGPQNWTLNQGKMPCPDWEIIYAETSCLQSCIEVPCCSSSFDRPEKRGSSLLRASDS